MEWFKTIKNHVLAINFVLLLLILGIMLGNSIFLLNTVRQNSREDTRNWVTVMADNFENEYFRLNSLMTLCNDDPDLVLALHSSSSDSRFMENLLTAQEKISLIKASMPYANDVYAYRSTDNTVLTIDKGIIAADTFWGRYTTGDLTEELLSTSNVLTSIDGGLYFICPIQNYGSIVIDINVKAFLDMLKVHSISPESHLLIFDSKGQVKLQSMPPLEASSIQEIPQEDRKVQMEGESYYVYSQDIPSIGYRCTILNSVNAVEINLRSVNAICILMLVAVTIFSVLLFIFNRRTYLPVQKLIAVFGSKEGKEDELAYITQRFMELSKKEQDASLTNGPNRLDVSLYYLFYNEKDDSSLDSMASQLYDGSRLALLACQDITGQPDRQLVASLVETFPGVVTVPCDACMTAFILPENVSKDSFLEYLLIQLNSRSNLKAFISFSDPFTGEDSIKESFEAALYALESTEIEAEELLTVSSSENHRKQIRYIKLEIQQQIVNCVIHSDMEVIKEVFEILLKGRSSLLEYRSICKEISSLLDYMVNTLSINLPGEPSIQPNYDRMYNPLYMTNNLLEHFRRISEAYQKGSHSNLRAQILEYLRQNYPKPLSLDLISDHFHITPAYLSSFFKKEIGENLSSYLANLRISEARRLLENTDMKVSEISEKVGIPSQTTFIRLFKKYCGLTPNEYRKSQVSGNRNHERNEE